MLYTSEKNMNCLCWPSSEMGSEVPIYKRIGWDKVRRSGIGSEVPIYKKIGLDKM